MKPLSSSWSEIEPALKEKIVMLFMDYDGTLTPLADHPRRARLSPAVKKLIREISHTPRLIPALVSGRSLAEIKRLVGIPGLIYSGNHGLELEGPGIRFTHPQALESKNLLAKIKGRLKATFKSFRGIFIEDKVFSLGVHYRRVAEAKVGKAYDIFLKTVRPYVKRERVLLAAGKKVWEVRPAARWNKGTTVLWLYGRVLAQSTEEKMLPVYIGDDRTDEDVFRALKPVGITIKVKGEGAEESDADYFVNSPAEAARFLKRLLVLKSKAGSERKKAGLARAETASLVPAEK